MRLPKISLRGQALPTALALAAELGCFALMAGHGDFPRAGEGWRISVLGVLAGVFFWLAVRSFLRVNTVSRSSSRRFFWLATLVLHLAALFTLPGDDLWRYRWEGKIQLAGFNPYQLAPDAAVLAPWRDGVEWAQINHPNLPAVYPPLTEALFAALAAVRLPVLGDKLFFALADLGVVALLRRLMADRAGGSPERAAWYAWNPLAVYLSAGAAHFDSLVVLALLGAILLLARCTESSAGGGNTSHPWRVSPAAWGSALLLGAAIALKIVPVVLLPVWAFALGWRRALLILPLAAGGPLTLGAVAYGFPGVPVFATLKNFSARDLVNDALWWLADLAVVAAGGAVSVVHRVGPWIAAGVCLGLACWFRRDWRRGVFWVMGAALLLGPAVHAWYVLWVLPLAVWRGEAAALRPWLVFSISVFGYYLLWETNHASGRPWEEPLWLRLGVYLPPALAWAWTWPRWQKNPPSLVAC